MKSVIFLTKGKEAPSFRHRLQPLINSLESKNVKCNILIVDNSNYVWRIWKHRSHIKNASAIICHKLLIPKIEVSVLSYLNNNILLDLDDAIYLKEPKWVGHERPRSLSREGKFHKIVRNCKHIITGNQHLKAHVESLGGKATIFPTAVEPNPKEIGDSMPSIACRIVWIGLPTNLRYLEMIRTVFTTLASKYPNIRLRIICSKFPDWQDIKIEKVFWSKAIEQQALAEADIGIMPLDENEYSKGKCAFKLLQYMSSELPCVASPIGANNDAVKPKVTGFLPSTEQEWINSLSYLIENPKERKKMGKKGKEIALSEYNQEIIARQYADFVIDQIS